MNKDQIIEALDRAFAAHVALMFGVLCNGMVEEAASSKPAGVGEDARQRFKNGFGIAVLARGEMVKSLTGE